MRVQFNWIYVAFHWVEEDPWRYFYSFFRPNELVGFAEEWLEKKCEAASWRALVVAAVATEPSIPVHDKGKRNIVNRMEEEQSCKFQAYPFVEKETMAIEAKRKQRDKRIA